MSPLDYIPSDNVRITTEYHQERIVNADIEAVSHRCLRFADKYGYSLDFSLPGIETLKSLLQRGIEWKDQNQLKSTDLETMIKLCGAYLGEVVRRVWGGDWIRFEDASNRPLRVIIKSRGAQLDPFTIVRQAIQTRSTSIIDQFIRDTQDILGVVSQQNIRDLFGDEESQEYYFVYWNDSTLETRDVSSCVETLQDENFPFGHHTHASITDIIYLGDSAARFRNFDHPMGAYTIQLPPYIFEQSFQSRQSRGGIKTLILGGNSKRDVAELMISSGFQLGNDVQSPHPVLVDKTLESLPPPILWNCPRCQEKNKTQIKTYDTIVRCNRCRSSFRCLAGQAKLADYYESSSLFSQEYHWVVRMSVGLNNIEEITFSTYDLNFIISPGDTIIAFFTNNGSGDIIASIENRTTYKCLIM